MEPAQNRRRDDSMRVRQSVMVRDGDTIWRGIGKPRSQAGVPTAAVVMSDPQLKGPSEMPLN
jgi:hypothetical protein